MLHQSLAVAVGSSAGVNTGIAGFFGMFWIKRHRYQAASLQGCFARTLDLTYGRSWPRQPRGRN
jgi:hypothetical protein